MFITYWERIDGCFLVMEGPKTIKTKKNRGGKDKVVEIDESKFGRRKYHRGHRVEGQWVFGGYERGTGRIFMVPVEKSSAKISATNFVYGMLLLRTGNASSIIQQNFTSVRQPPMAWSGSRAQRRTRWAVTIASMTTCSATASSTVPVAKTRTVTTACSTRRQKRI